MCYISPYSDQKSVSDNSSVPEESGNLEDMLQSSGKRHFQHRRRNLIPKNVATELFTVSLVLSVQYYLPLHERREDAEAVYSDSATV